MLKYLTCLLERSKNVVDLVVKSESESSKNEDFF